MAIEIKLPIPLVVVLLCFLGASCAQTPEEETIKLLGGSNWSEAHSIEKTNDGGYIIVGTINSNGIGSESIWLVKTDSKGETKWEKTPGVSKSLGRQILRTDDDRYLITAITELKNNTDLDALLIKINSTGIINLTGNEKEIGGTGVDQIYSIIKTNDNNYITVGEKESPDTKHTDIWLIKVDENATEIWSKKLLDEHLFSWNETPGKDGDKLKDFLTQKFGIVWGKNANIEKADDNKTINLSNGENYASLKLNDNEVTLDIDNGRTGKFIARMENGKLNIYPDNNINRFGRSITQKSDGDYLIAGYSSPPGSAQSDILLLEADLEGNLKNNRTIYNLTNKLSVLGLDKAYFINKTKDGYFIVGTNESLNSDEKDSWIVKFFENGTEHWNYGFNDKGYNAASSAIETDDGGYVIVGSTNVNDHGSLDAWIAKINSSGSLEWSNALGGAGYDIGNAVLQADDGGFLIAGATGSYGNRTLNGWLVKVNSTGFEEWNTTLGVPVFVVNAETIPEKYNATIADWDERYISPVLNGTILILKPILIIIGVVLGIIFFWLVLIRLYHELYNVVFKQKRQLFVADLENVSGDKSFDDTRRGLSEQMRELLLKNLDNIGQIIRTHNDELGIHKIKRSPEFFYVPEGTEVTPLKELINSLKDTAPQETKSLFSFLSFIYPKPYGVKINCFFQGHKDQSEVLGITSRMADERGNQKIRLRTFWDRSTKSSACVNKPLKSEMKAEYLKIIIDSLEQIGNFSDALKYKKELLKTKLDLNRKIDEPEKEKLLELAQKQKNAELSRAFYNLAKEQKGNWLLSESFYRESLNHIDEKSPPIWCNHVLADNIGEQYFNLAEVYKKYGLLDEAIELLLLSKAICKETIYKKLMDEIQNIESLKLKSLKDISKNLQDICRYSEAKGYLQSALTISPNDNEAKSLLEKVDLELVKDKKAYERCQGLLEPASWWLAVEITKWALLDSLPQYDNRCEYYRYLAGVYIFSGTLILSSPFRNTYKEFYDIAKDNLKTAKSLCEDWYRPYALLGDLDFMRSSSEPSDKNLINSAIISYEIALKKIGRECNIQVLYDEGLIKYPTIDCNKEMGYTFAKEYLEVNLILSKFLYCILYNDYSIISDIKNKIFEVLTKRTGLPRYVSTSSSNVPSPFSYPDMNGLSPKDPKGLSNTTSLEEGIKKWLNHEKGISKSNKIEPSYKANINSEIGEILKSKDEKTKGERLDLIVLEINIHLYLRETKSAKALYNFACLWGLIYTNFSIGHKIVNNKDELKKLARKFLVYALARDRYKDTWVIAEKDPDLKGVIKEEMIRKIKFKLNYLAIERNTKIEDLAESDSFNKDVEDILNQLSD